MKKSKILIIATILSILCTLIITFVIVYGLYDTFSTPVDPENDTTPIGMFFIIYLTPALVPVAIGSFLGWTALFKSEVQNALTASKIYLVCSAISLVITQDAFGNDVTSYIPIGIMVLFPLLNYIGYKNQLKINQQTHSNLE